MFGVPYVNTYNPQASVDRINNQITELEKMKEQISHQSIQTPTNLTQNFQITPNNNTTMRYANSIDEVEKDFVIGDTPYFSKDLSVLWIKNTKGEIKAYELNEIVQKDEKDLKIELLESQLNELKGRIANESNTTDVISAENETDTTRNDDTARTTTKKN